MPVKLENAGVEALLHVMVRVTAQFEMLGALVEELDIEGAYARHESVVAVLDCAMSRISEGTNYNSLAEATNQDETSYDDTDNIDKVDKTESSKSLKSIDHK